LKRTGHDSLDYDRPQQRTFKRVPSLFGCLLGLLIPSSAEGPHKVSCKILVGIILSRYYIYLLFWLGMYSLKRHKAQAKSGLV